MDTPKHGAPRNPVEGQRASGDSFVAPGPSEAEDLDPAKNKDALEQDPEKVPNRLQEPEPPREEEVGL